MRGNSIKIYNRILNQFCISLIVYAFNNVTHNPMRGRLGFQGWLSSLETAGSNKGLGFQERPAYFYNFL
jgi:hypothetical protein